MQMNIYLLLSSNGVALAIEMSKTKNGFVTPSLASAAAGPTPTNMDYYSVQYKTFQRDQR